MQDGCCSPTVVGGHKEMLIDAVLVFALSNDLASYMYIRRTYNYVVVPSLHPRLLY